MEVSILTPMLVQYLVGLCCLRWDPDAIDITIGDMVPDVAAAGKKRDVDVTVTIAEDPGVTYAFKAYEVKRERSPLDLTDVEQLCLKFLDMPSVTHKAIVSSSGFTESAQAKAAYHGIELYAIKQWSKPMEEQFPVLTMQGLPQDCLRFFQILLCWINPQFRLSLSESLEAFTVQPDDTLFTDQAKVHPQFETFAIYTQELLLRSTNILIDLEPATTIRRTFSPTPISTESGIIAVGPDWPHTHTLDVACDNVYIKIADKFVRLDNITINGYLQWQRMDKPTYYLIERVPDGETFAGAIVAMGVQEDSMFALTVSPKSREIGFHPICLTKKHKNAIRKLKIKLPIHSPN